jgi:Nucleoside 2-deoxyribosyltransferase
MKIYLAGKVAQMDWRHRLVYTLRDAVLSMETWVAVKSLPMIGGHDYVGPFFIACDHGCSHGPGSHGAAVGNEASCAIAGADAGHENDNSPTRVHAKGVDGIQRCDVFIAWMGLDFATAYGTMYEIGVAKALHKKIVIIKHRDLETRDFWFSMEAADLILATSDPVFAIEQLLTPASSDRHYSLASLNPKHRVAA